jgi:hypothetical protein
MWDTEFLKISSISHHISHIPYLPLWIIQCLVTCCLMFRAYCARCLVLEIDKDVLLI